MDSKPFADTEANVAADAGIRNRAVKRAEKARTGSGDAAHATYTEDTASSDRPVAWAVPRPAAQRRCSLKRRFGHSMTMIRISSDLVMARFDFLDAVFAFPTPHAKD
jgi:hypothetical protein